MQPMLYCRDVSSKVCCIADTMTYESLTLGTLKQKCLGVLQAVMVKHIEGMLIYYGYNPRTEASVSNSQVVTLVNDICKKYHYLNISDVCLCFEMARQNPSEWGKFYGRFDASVVMGWFSKYDSKRDEVIQSYPTHKPYTPSLDDITEDMYMDSLLAKAAGGDEEASKQYHYALETRNRIAKSNGLLAAYRYNRQHRSF